MARSPVRRDKPWALASGGRNVIELTEAETESPFERLEIDHCLVLDADRFPVVD